MQVSCTLMVSRALNDEQTCTPPTAHNTKIAPSRTLSDRSTSTVKSTCPRISKVMSKSINMYAVNLPLLQPTKFRTLYSFAVCRIIQCCAGIMSKEDNILFCTRSFQPKTIKLRWDDKFVILTLASVMEIKFCGVAIQMNEYFSATPFQTYAAILKELK